MTKIIEYVFRKFGYRIENKKLVNKGRDQFLSAFNVELNKGLLISSYDYIVKINKHLKIQSIEDFNKGVIVGFNDLKVYIESWEEFFIITEVFIDKEYNFLLNEDCVVIDIGCNIGLASLFFATKHNVKKIISFEPVTDTFDNALINFELNKELSSKIELHNFGLGCSNRDETFLFDCNIKGNTGIRGKESINYKMSNSNEKRDVKIRKTSEVFSEMISNNKPENFVFKIDCEGAEYEIFDDLDKNDLISKVKMFMIEWHDEGADILEKILIKNGFAVFSKVTEVNSGILYAYNTKI